MILLLVTASAEGGQGVEPGLNIANCELVEALLPEARDDVQPYERLVRDVGRRLAIWFDHFIKPAGEEFAELGYFVAKGPLRASS